jgi:hypothetical protein
MSALHPTQIGLGPWDRPLLTGKADILADRIAPTGDDPFQTSTILCIMAKPESSGGKVTQRGLIGGAA